MVRRRKVERVIAWAGLECESWCGCRDLKQTGAAGGMLVG